MSRHKHEARDLAGMLRRMMRALVRRAGEGDDRALVELVALQAELAAAITDAGAALYVRGDMSYTDIAGELGVSRQAARQRFLPAVQRLTPAPAQGIGHVLLDGHDAATGPPCARAPPRPPPGRPPAMRAELHDGHEFLVTA
jgi:hypothetical protein